MHLTSTRTNLVVHYFEELPIIPYVSVAILTLLTWTWLLCVPEEIEVIRRKGISIPILTYYLSRTSSVACCIINALTTTEFDILPMATIYVAGIFMWIAHASTALLFLLRVFAIYRNSKSIRLAFFFLWVILAVSPIAFYLTKDVICYLQNHYCYGSGPLSLIVNGLTFINDNLVLVAVSRQIYNNIAADAVPVPFGTLMQQIVWGNGLYKISKVLLRSGQLYYGVTITALAGTAVCSFLSIFVAQVAYMAYVALSSAMACKVFRMVILCDTTLGVVRTEDIEEALKSVPTVP